MALIAVQPHPLKALQRNSQKYGMPNPSRRLLAFARYASPPTQLNVLDLTGERFPFSDSKK